MRCERSEKKQAIMALEESLRRIKDHLDSIDKAREQAIRLSRDVIRLSSQIISSVVSGNKEEARKALEELEFKKAAFYETVRHHGELLYSGITNNTLSEYVEAKIVSKLVIEERIPGQDELEVPPVPYLQGLGDSIGELRRIVLEKVRANRLEDAWRILEIMEEVFARLYIINYPDPLVPGFRHKIDVARRLIDDTKVMLIDLTSRRDLEKALESIVRRGCGEHQQ
uniref:Haloacid dehalogenase n=1 Tax=Fervidicoccus fontis TaxID=683846 RepID=A0A7J3ZLC9_9CREN